MRVSLFKLIFAFAFRHALRVPVVPSRPDGCIARPALPTRSQNPTSWFTMGMNLFDLAIVTIKFLSSI
jgi:hypothetical protein